MTMTMTMTMTKMSLKGSIFNSPHSDFVAEERISDWPMTVVQMRASAVVVVAAAADVMTNYLIFSDFPTSLSFGPVSDLSECCSCEGK